MPRRIRILAVLLTATSVLAFAPAAEAAGWLEKNFWLSGPRYSGKLPPCDHPVALSKISSVGATEQPKSPGIGTPGVPKGPGGVTTWRMTPRICKRLESALTSSRARSRCTALPESMFMVAVFRVAPWSSTKDSVMLHGPVLIS